MRFHLGLLVALAALGVPQIAFARAATRDGNTLRLEQSGAENVALVRQAGGGNEIHLIQTGVGSAACLVQMGRELTLNVAQTGDGEDLVLMQTRGTTHALPTQACRAVARARSPARNVGPTH